MRLQPSYPPRRPPLTSLDPPQPAAPSFKPTPIAPSLPPKPSLPSHPSGSSAVPTIDIAAKRAEIQAKLAAMKAAGSLPTASAATPPPPPPSASIPPRPPAGVGPAPPAGGKPNLDPELARKIAEAKRKVAEMAAKKQAQDQARANPYLVRSLLTLLYFIKTDLDSLAVGELPGYEEGPAGRPVGRGEGRSVDGSAPAAP